MAGLTDKQKHILGQKLCDMKNRCNNPNNKFFKDYGARGIKVCEEWMDKKNGHANFQKWAIENGWKEYLSIDRIDVNGNYEPSNCRWATQKEQANNRRNNVYVTIHGITKTAQEWSEQVGITERAFVSRLDYGWDEDRLLEPKYKPLKMTKAEMAKEIRYWRNLEEQGLLMKLPLAKEDAFWEINRGTTPPSYYKRYAHSYQHCVYVLERLGKTCFLTEKEAEKALAEMEK